MSDDNGGRGGSIVVLGGYGAVGKAAAEILGRRFPGRVVVAGRSWDRAERLARSSGAKLRAARVDVEKPEELNGVLRDAALVVMCVERANTAVARACLERGVHYVDVSASAPVLESIAALHDLAVSNAATAVLSVGVAPGLTNLLARHCAERLPAARTVDLSLLLGLGGEHGADSVRWVVDHLLEPGGRGSRPRRARVRLGRAGVRTVHPFSFSDQYTVGQALGVRATTRICFDSRLVTSVVFGLRTAGFFALLRRLRAGSPLAALVGRLHFGSDGFVVHASASDGSGAGVTGTVTGRETCHATGAVAALVAQELYGDAGPGGVVHIDRFPKAASLLDELAEHGMSVRWSGDRVGT
ncbi:saccharopine dehydrogenase family protein [Actinomadura sp. SCN-SB]|uniref:saccharopine dehydrogenase family protein n=1 Tax=Actinomadura sp. SCN-SB TaxID=3373092 RepID=UPI003753B1CC